MAALFGAHLNAFHCFNQVVLGNIGTLFTGNGFAAAWMPLLGWSIVLLMIAFVTVLVLKRKNADIALKEKKKEAAV